MTVDMTGVVKKIKSGILQVLDCKCCFQGLLVFEVPVHFIYLLEHDPG